MEAKVPTEPAKPAAEAVVPRQRAARLRWAVVGRVLKIETQVKVHLLPSKST